MARSKRDLGHYLPRYGRAADLQPTPDDGYEAASVLLSNQCLPQLSKCRCSRVTLSSITPETGYVAMQLQMRQNRLQVKVQEPGGPEETYHVTCKWAATVDIRNLTQFVA